MFTDQYILLSIGYGYGPVHSPIYSVWLRTRTYTCLWCMVMDQYNMHLFVAYGHEPAHLFIAYDYGPVQYAPISSVCYGPVHAPIIFIIYSVFLRAGTFT